LSIRLPQSARVTRVHALVSGQNRPFRVKEGTVQLEIPSVGIHEVVALDLAQA